jgi:hypothetical protein
LLNGWESQTLGADDVAEKDRRLALPLSFDRHSAHGFWMFVEMGTWPRHEGPPQGSAPTSDNAVGPDE